MDNILQCHEIFKTDFVRGENCYLYDSQGRRYVDFESGIWCTVLGHCHSRLNRVMRAQIDRVIHLGTRYPHVLAQAAAIDVVDVVGMDEGKCVFLSSGSEAVELGVQIARRTTGRQLLLTFSNCYLAAYGSAGKKSADEWWLLDWSLCANSDSYECLEEIPFDRIGAFVLEPGGSGSGFVQFPPTRLVREIAQRVTQEGGLLMVNEITTGMGRTGKWFGFQHYGIQPDIVALGKGLGNGYPVSAVAVRRDIAERLEHDGFRYAQSHQNDPLGCAVAREVIAILREEDWVERGALVGKFFLDELQRLEEKHAIVKEARGRGMLLALELHPNQDLHAQSIYETLLKHGFLVGCYPAGNVLRFDPALTMQKKDIVGLLDDLIAILGASCIT
jgi:acetylornithine/N-succinyldiaminopimelate aminotransferase